jgi:tetratricopeptide (TPR) repeat protein
VVKRLVPLAVLAALLVAAPAAQDRGLAVESPAIREVNAAFRAAYNLDYDEAIARARAAVRLDPENPRTHRGLASIIWVSQVFRRGAVTVDYYLGSISTRNLTLPKPDPALAEEFEGALERAIDLAERRLRRNPDDLTALMDVGSGYGVKASYVASVQGNLANAFRYARRAYDAMNTVLERDPARASAGTVVGTYRYLVASQPMFIRWFAYLAGFGGDKEKAIQILEAASHDPLSRVDAKTALVLIYSREGRHSEAMRLAHELSLELPRNRLFVLEEGSAAIRAGRAGEAEAILTRGLAQFEADTRPKVLSEHAIWLYKRGLARLNLNHPDDATVDLRQALSVGPAPWVEGRIHVALGKIADLAGRRPDAVAAYTRARLLCADSSDQLCEDDARRYLKSPFKFEGK